MSVKNYLITLLGLLLLVAVITFIKFKQPPVVADPVVITGEAAYQCADGHTIKAVFSKQGPTPVVVPGEPPLSNASVALSLDSAAQISLPQTLSADGARYANSDESLVFWSKGSGAMLQENGQEQTYQSCIVVKSNAGDLPQVYLSQSNHFTLRYPANYTAQEDYAYQGLGPEIAITGVRFTVPEQLATGTNLSQDSYLSVERRDEVSGCSAVDFLPSQLGLEPQIIKADNFTYSFASSTDAAVGNRYEEYVYALADSSPCLAIRYFIHYTALENYDPGTVSEFDRKKLLNQFDAIRRSLTLDAPLVPTLRLNADAYPLYPNLSWQPVSTGEFAELSGQQIKSQPLQNITDIASSTQPFVEYYQQLLTQKGWTEDISRAAGGPGSAVIAYEKAGKHIILQYRSDFSVITEDEPAQCPCSVEFMVFTSTE